MFVSGNEIEHVGKIARSSANRLLSPVKTGIPSD
jgi:hypothetical protein